MELSEIDLRVVNDAFQRGATADEAHGLLVARRSAGVSGSSRLSGALPLYGDADARTVALVAPVDGPPIPDAALREAVERAHSVHLETIRGEFGGVTVFVQQSFGYDPKRPETYDQALTHYHRMRAAYYRDGWRCPAESIFKHIAPATFFGRPVVGGVHVTLRDVLIRVEQHVRRTNPEAARQMSAETFTIGGFNPRLIAGQDDLSNHAFGLALDIDPNWNPMVKRPAEISAFRQSTGVEFGDWVFAASSVDQLAQIYRKVAQASEKLKAWLRRMLPAYYDEQVVRRDLNSAKGKAARAAAAVKEKQLNDHVRTDPDRAALKTLIDAYTLPVVKSWADYGIVTVPAAVVAAWAGAHPKARWGGEYRHSKDMMHVELLAPALLAAERGPRVGSYSELVGKDPVPAPSCRAVVWPTADRPPRQPKVAPLR